MIPCNYYAFISDSRQLSVLQCRPNWIRLGALNRVMVYLYNVVEKTA